MRVSDELTADSTVSEIKARRVKRFLINSGIVALAAAVLWALGGAEKQFLLPLPLLLLIGGVLVFAVWETVAYYLDKRNHLGSTA